MNTSETRGKDTHVMGQEVGLSGAGRQGGGEGGEAIPMTGEEVRGFEEVERIVKELMTKIGARAATVAVALDGRPVYSRGFGWRDKEKLEPTRPDDLMRIASLSKLFTKALLKDLIRSGFATPETPLLSCLPFPREALEAVSDQRLHRVALGQVLEHRGGWDRAMNPDVMFRLPEISQAMGLTAPMMPLDMIRYMLSQPLQFDPGEKSCYSNVGYCFLGRVIEHLTGLSYGSALEQHLLLPLGIQDVQVARSLEAHRHPREVCYLVPGDGLHMEVRDACGGLIASAPALLEFLKHRWINGDPRNGVFRGCSYQFFGSLPGTTSMVHQGANGIDAVVLFNSRRNNDSMKEITKELKDRITAALSSALAPTSQSHAEPSETS